MAKPLLGITMGDINGVGPEILVKALARRSLWDCCVPVVLGSKRVYDSLAAKVDGAPASKLVERVEDASSVLEVISFLNDDVAVPEYAPGILSAEAGMAAMKWLDTAVDLTMAGRLGGIVTCPINKEGIHAAGYTVQGHTDFIAEKTDTQEYRMCLFTDTMRVVHITGHLSLRDALDAITTDRILESIRIGHAALERLALSKQRIAVAGVNPHAGENGAFGSEEKEIVRPAIDKAQSEGIDCSGPYPADTIFRRMADGHCEMVIAMYHDQGHGPMKLIAMDEGVNVTLGIPIVRTSVDHGTAYDIAGKNLAREDSLIAACRMAAQLA